MQNRRGCMGRTNKRNRDKIYNWTASRDGEYCWICGIEGDRNSLVVDHWDGDNSNNDPENWRLLCQSCNIRKNPRGRARFGSSRRTFEQATINSEELRINRRAEPAYNRWVWFLLCDHKKKEVRSIPYTRAISGGAQVVKVSPMTTRRYLDKLISDDGPLKEFTDDLGVRTVTIKHEKIPWNNGGSEK